MYWNCINLETAPELPASRMFDACYYGMFMSCTKLNYIKCLATSSNNNNVTTSWVNGVARTGMFIKHPNMTRWSIGVNGIPTNWTIENAPQ